MTVEGEVEMAMEGQAGAHTLRLLTKSERDRCMQRVAEELALAPEREEGEALRPRWISPAELVRRVAPFLGRN
jgi:hypothetical protein